MIPEEVLPAERSWQGDIQALALKVRRSPMLARELHLVYLVQFVSERWREAADLQTVSDEAPVTAWIIRRKSDLVLPQRQVAGEDALEESGADGTDALWLAGAVQGLRSVFEAAQMYHGHASHSGDHEVYHPVKGADLLKLVGSWPQLRPPKPAIAPQLVRDDEYPLEQRMEWLLRTLHQRAGLVGFRDVADSPQPGEVVGAFLAVVHLWHQNQIAVHQDSAYDEIWLDAGGKRP